MVLDSCNELYVQENNVKLKTSVQSKNIHKKHVRKTALHTLNVYSILIHNALCDNHKPVEDSESPIS